MRPFGNWRGCRGAGSRHGSTAGGPGSASPTESRTAARSPGKLADRHADVVYLGVALLGRQSERFRQDYWEHVVLATGARRVIPVHWDDMRTTLDKPLKPPPRAADDLDTSLRFLDERGRADGVEVLLPHAWSATDPFTQL